MTDRLKESLDYLITIQDNAIMTIISEMRDKVYENVENEELANLIEFRKSDGIKDIELIELYADVSIELDQLKDKSIELKNCKPFTKKLLLYVLEEVKENIPYTDYCNIRFILKGLSPELNFELN